MTPTIEDLSPHLPRDVIRRMVEFFQSRQNGQILLYVENGSVVGLRRSDNYRSRITNGSPSQTRY